MLRRLRSFDIKLEALQWECRLIVIDMMSDSGGCNSQSKCFPYVQMAQCTLMRLITAGYLENPRVTDFMPIKHMWNVLDGRISAYLNTTQSLHTVRHVFDEECQSTPITHIKWVRNYIHRRIRETTKANRTYSLMKKKCNGYKICSLDIHFVKVMVTIFKLIALSK